MALLVGLVASGCGSDGPVAVGGRPTAVIDVWDALADAGGFSFTFVSGEEYDPDTEVTATGQRDVERGVSVDTITTRVSARRPVVGAVDESPTEGTLVEEVVTLGGRAWTRTRPPAGEERAWATSDGFGGGYGASSGPYDEAGFDPTGVGIMRLVAVAAEVDEWTASPRGSAGPRWRGEVESYGDRVAVDLELDRRGRLIGIDASDGSELDLTPLDREVTATEPSPTTDAQTAYGSALYGGPVGPWEVESSGRTDGGPWQVQRADGERLGHEVPCRILLSAQGADDDGWDEIDPEWSYPECGVQGEGLLAGAVADPALQVLVPDWVWEVGPDREVVVPVAVVVSPRFAAYPVRLARSDGTTTEVALDEAGVGIFTVDGADDTWVEAFVLDASGVDCPTTIDEWWVEDNDAEGLHPAVLYSALPLSCTR